MCLSFKYPLIWGTPILLPFPSSLSVLTLEERWKGYVLVLRGVRGTHASTCVLLMLQRNIRREEGTPSSPLSPDNLLLLKQSKAAAIEKEKGIFGFH